MEEEAVKSIAKFTHICVEHAEETGTPLYLDNESEQAYCSMVDCMNARDLIECDSGCGYFDVDKKIRGREGILMPSCTYKKQAED